MGVGEQGGRGDEERGRGQTCDLRAIPSTVQLYLTQDLTTCCDDRLTMHAEVGEEAGGQASEQAGRGAGRLVEEVGWGQ